MIARIPVKDGIASTCSIMSYGFDPEVSIESPFHGAYFAVIASMAKLIASGADRNKIRFTFQEYFEKLGFDTNYTYLLEEDYINKTKHKINIAEKLRELNILRHENFITNSDYDKTKLDLIEQAKSNNSAGPNPETKPNVTEKTNLSSIR